MWPKSTRGGARLGSEGRCKDASRSLFAEEALPLVVVRAAEAAVSEPFHGLLAVPVRREPAKKRGRQGLAFILRCLRAHR